MRTRWMMAGLLTLLVLAASPAHAVEARAETLWIFDADFEDLLGDNAGWVSQDVSGTIGFENYWHKDTIRINGFEWLGDSTWWCGTTNPCWRQPRGYGNSWYQLMWRDFPLSEWSDAGDEVALGWDQRFAMENEYDYGYVEISANEGATWTVLAVYDNPGFAGSPGVPQDWDSDTYGHPELDLSAYAGSDLRLRFRFESDVAYSAQDEFENSWGSVKDGAWQLDNIEWRVNDVTVWLDDCEFPGDNGWQHPDIPAAGQTGVTFRRSLETVMGDPRWMMVAYDEESGVMVDDESALLFSPAINIAAAPELVAEWYYWIDLPECSNDRVSLDLATGDEPECITFGGMEPPFSWYGGPFAAHYAEEISGYGGNDWLKMSVYTSNREPEDSLGCHGVGFMLDRFRVGVPLETNVPDEPALATRLLAPSPNPFNPATTIAYTLASEGHAAVRVFDAAGRLVCTLVDREHEAGEHATTWDGRTDAGDRAASGVYFVRMEADVSTGEGADRGGSSGPESRQQKLVLLK